MDELLFASSLDGHYVEVWDGPSLTVAECTCGWINEASSRTAPVEQAEAHLDAVNVEGHIPDKGTNVTNLENYRRRFATRLNG